MKSDWHNNTKFFCIVAIANNCKNTTMKLNCKQISINDEEL